MNLDELCDKIGGGAAAIAVVFAIIGAAFVVAIIAMAIGAN